jgi:PAS domain S-box-containing protein
MFRGEPSYAFLFDQSNKMKDPLYVLVIDDNPDDRALVIRELRRQFSAIEIEEIIDSHGFEKAMQNGQFDLVITDYQLLWTDGLTLLRALKARWPDLPVVMFTGTGSEEVAVEAMKSGLDDYVLKSPKHYSRLPAAAKVALKMARQRQELKEAESRYTVLFNSVPVGLYRTSATGEILDANPALAEMLGYDNQAALLALKTSELFVNVDDYLHRKELLDREGVLHNFETQLHCHDGSNCWVQDNAKVVHNAQTHEIYYEGSLENITKRKEAEFEREQLISELQDALAEVKTLSGLLPICAQCKKIRDDNGYWNQIEVFIQSHSDAEFTHSFCPDCMKRLYPEVSIEGVPS